MKKNILIGGLNKSQREKELEKTKIKYSKKGYKFINYFDNGTLKSVAIFEVDEDILREEKSQKLLFVGGFIMITTYLIYQNS